MVQFHISFAIGTDQTLWKLKTFDFTALNCCSSSFMFSKSRSMWWIAFRLFAISDGLPALASTHFFFQNGLSFSILTISCHVLDIYVHVNFYSTNNFLDFFGLPLFCQVCCFCARAFLQHQTLYLLLLLLWVTFCTLCTTTLHTLTNLLTGDVTCLFDHS